MRLALVWSLCLIVAMPLGARAALDANDPMESLGGHVVADLDGTRITFPTLRTEITGDLQGDIATITVRQVFENPTQTPLNARYLFPLNMDAAVHAMTMKVGNEVVTAVIKKRGEARETFETAKQEGKAAALLEQQRPNMFTKEIANLMPGLPVTVTLEYSQVIPRVDGAYELRVPLVVGPRYVPAPEPALLAEVDFDPQPVDDEAPASATAGKPGEWSFDALPAYPEVAGLTIPPLIDKDRVSLDFTLTSGVPIGSITSATHALDVAGGENKKAIALTGGTTIDNRDFVLRYSLAGAAPQAGVLTHRDAEGGTFSILIEPPEAPREGDIAAREMVFVLDTSGSMSGRPIEASKTFMRHALKTLRPADYFRIIQFSNRASEFSSGPVPATPENLAAGERFVAELRASGGTEVLRGLDAAYARPTPPNLLRIVVFLSDGYVSNEDGILRKVAGDVGKGRLYAFGIGSSVNRYLIVEMARQGRGLSRVIDPTADGQAEAIAFAGSLRSPVLTDIEFDWGTLAPDGVTPALIPDLFEGDSIRVQGLFKGGAERTVQVRGRVNGHPVSMPLLIPATEDGSPEGKAIPLIWARSRIADNMREMMVPPQLRQTGMDDAAIEKAVTELGLTHSLVTQWTSFVAVSQQVVNSQPQAARDADVPLQMVEGVTPAAYPNAPQGNAQPTFAPTKAQAGGTQLAFGGGGTPEPERLLGLLLLALTLAGAALRLRPRTKPT
jgi:Ca-activated chloride channel family protein